MGSGWAAYTADMPNEELLNRLLVVNMQRSSAN